MPGEFKNTFLELTAIYSEKIRVYNEERGWKYQLFIALLYNGAFSVFLSVISSLFVSVILSIFTKRFDSSWYVSFKICLVLNGLMLFLNLSSKALNMPMLFLKAVFFIKDRFTTTSSFFKHIVVPYAVTGVSIYVMYYIILDFFNGFHINGEIAEIYSIILSVGLAVAGCYSFPVEKDIRDINELIISPILIIANIGIGYVISKENVINNLKLGHEKIASYIFILFLIAACLQVITYFKKLFEKLHDPDLSKYEKDITAYAGNGKEKMESIKKHVRFIIEEINRVVKEVEFTKKDKGFYFHFLAWISISLIIVIGVNYISKIIFIKFEKPIIVVLTYIVLFGLVIFLINKLGLFIYLAFIKREGVSKGKRWEYFGLACFIFSMLLSMITMLFSINLNFVIIVFFVIAFTIFGITSFIGWLLKKDEGDENIQEEK
ncbi:teichoic acid transporter [Bacillus manliponensis]|uniref:teichoic acid transporter n=1 Tax=Bacillus manliponensis TaxID=574376 RepID=UPI0035174718